jgi:hypothetical protein
MAAILDDVRLEGGQFRDLMASGITDGVARVQPDRGLVEHVERADELRAELVGEVDALGLAARERARLAAQGQVAEPDALEEGELGAQLRGAGRTLAGDGQPRARRGRHLLVAQLLRNLERRTIGRAEKHGEHIRAILRRRLNSAGVDHFPKPLGSKLRGSPGS